MKNKTGFFDKQSFVLFVLLLAITYLVPGSLIKEIELHGDYVCWFMGKFPVFEYIAMRSIDPDGYKLFFSMIVWFIPVFTVVYYKKPLEFNVAKIHSNKIFFIFGWLIFMPLLLVGGIFSFQAEVDNHTFFIFKEIIDIAANSRFMLVLIFDGVVCFYSAVIAAIITSAVHLHEFL